MSIAVSVIIPIYNKSEYIQRCARSLISQSFKNFEVLFVDDGSTDDSADLCEEIVKNDSRFRLIIQKNAGVAVARNFGIKAAQGKYLAFVDPDDTVDEDFLKELFEKAESEKAQITCCGYITKRNDITRDEFLPEKEDKKTILLNLVKEHPIYNNMCTKLYLREFIVNEGILVPDGIIIGEDALFNLRAYAAAERMTVVKKPLYYYHLYETSTMNTKNDKVNRLIFIEKRCELASSLDLMNETCEILAEQIYKSGGNVKKTLKKVKIDNKLLQIQINTGIYQLVKQTEHLIFRLKRKFITLIGRRK